MKHFTNFGLKVIKITTKSDLDKDHYLIFPPITKNHYYIRTPSGTWNQNKGSYCTPRTPARVANVQKYNLEQWFSIYGQFTHFGYNLVFTAIFCRQPLKCLSQDHKKPAYRNERNGKTHCPWAVVYVVVCLYIVL